MNYSRKPDRFAEDIELLKSHAIDTIKSKFPQLNEEQLKAIQTIDGPLQLIAGPGSGKTLVLVLRALYLLLADKVEPRQIVLTTFGEKAAFEIRDRLHQCAKLCEYKGPLYEMEIGTIHSLCEWIIRRHTTHIPWLTKNYLVLDELKQYLFLNDNFDTIVTEQSKINNLYFGQWNDKWSTIKGIIPYFNKISEEVIDTNRFIISGNPFLLKLKEAYQKYTETLFKSNRIDHAHQQKIVYDLLQKTDLLEEIKNDVKYILVDEYQDTNYIQEQILLKLARPFNNICVVGDEDQALYRFRGATVRNMLEFDTHFQNCHKIILNINYRSHPKIVNAYNHFMQSIDWSNPNGKIDFRCHKTIKVNPTTTFPDYPAIFSIQGTSELEEGRKFAQLVKYLKENNIIHDYNEVALLLHSVRLKHSRHYMKSLEDFGIPYFAPRARRFFENEEIRVMIACYALLFSFQGNMLSGLGFITLRNYIDEAIANLKLCCQTNPQLEQYMLQRARDIDNLKEGDILDMHILDYFYELLAYSPFSEIWKNQNTARNLAKFSQLLEIFQSYYHVEVVTERNKQWIPNMLFASFFKLLLDTGIDDYEDSDNPTPAGHVQIMTVHQSKGLEFPVVVVGSLDPKKSTIQQIDRELHHFYQRELFEPEHRINDFDLMRQYYVAFSRAERLLVLTSNKKCNYLIDPIWNRLDRWPDLTTNILSKQKFNGKEQFIPKRSYSLTSHINMFEVCPKKYQFHVEYEFSPSRSASRTFGNLIHQTNEDIHKIVLNGNLANITNESVRTLIESNYRSLLSIGMISLTKQHMNRALDHVLDYFNQNYDILSSIVKSEEEISVEKSGYILTGKIDLLLEKNGKFEILDFKTEQKPNDEDPLLQRYHKQLYLYAYIFKERYGKYPHRLFIYWTSERDRDQALMEVPFNDNDITSAGEYFDSVITTIQKKDFEIKKPTELEICRKCDFRRHCAAKGVIKLKLKNWISREF